MLEEMKVKFLTKDMFDECVSLYIDVFSREPWNEVYESREQIIPYFENSIANNYCLGYVAVCNDQIVALCVGAKKPWRDGIEYYIDEFCVHPDMQGKGIGSKFLKVVEEKVKEQGVRGMFLNTEKGYPAMKFYEKNGFSPVGNLIVLAK